MNKYLIKKFIASCIVTFMVVVALCSCASNNNNEATVETSTSIESLLNVESDNINTQKTVENVVDMKLTMNFYFGERTGIYTGELLDNLPHGYGSFASVNPNGDKWTYDGEWVMGHFHGKGSSIWKESKYIGEYSNDYRHGNGQYYVNDVLVYEGQFINDQFADENQVVSALESQQSSSNSSSKNNDNAFNSDLLLEQLTIDEYSWKSRYYDFVSLIIKNNSTYNLDLEVNLLFYDSNNKVIGTSNDSITAFESDKEIYLSFANEELFDHYEYSFVLKEETYFKSILSNLTYEVNETDKKLILSVTNSGDIAAQFVEYNVIYFKGNQIVDTEWGYATDNDSEIKPNQTEYRDFSKPTVSYDSYKVFLSGRAE